MAKDKFTAVWVSHTSLTDYLKCPRSYFLKNVYKDPKTGHKIQLMSPAMALGSAVHEVIESLSILPTEDRFRESLVIKLDKLWPSYTGKKGGFLDLDSEHRFLERGKEMLRRVMDNPGPLKNKAVKINQDLPSYWISEEDNIILCGKVDWLEYYPETDTVHIIDFKTGKSEEDPSSLQLPIYLLLVKNCQKRQAVKASYWYLGQDDGLVEKQLPDTVSAEAQILKVARQIKLARKLNKFNCPAGESGCHYCTPLESILQGKGELVGVGQHNHDIYILDQGQTSIEEQDSYIL